MRGPACNASNPKSLGRNLHYYRRLFSTNLLAGYLLAFHYLSINIFFPLVCSFVTVQKAIDIDLRKKNCAEPLNIVVV